MPLVYIAQNLTNCKVYIGMTSKDDISQRLKDHLKSVQQGSKLPFHNAIRKYGINNFDVQYILVTNSEEAFNNERLLITIFQSRDENLGYNLTDGGEGHLNPGPLARAKMAENGRQNLKNLSDIAKANRIMKLREIWNTSEFKSKISTTMKQYWKDSINREKHIVGIKNSANNPISKSRRSTTWSSKTKCRNGHTLTDDNIYKKDWMNPKTGYLIHRRRCKECNKIRDRKRTEDR